MRTTLSFPEKKTKKTTPPPPPIIAKNLTLTGFAALSLIHSTPAHAINIDFQSLEQVDIVLDSYTEKGFLFDSVSIDGDGAFAVEGTLSPNYQGSTALWEIYDFTRLLQVDGGAFDLASIDLTAFSVGLNRTVNFTGTKADFSTVTQSFTTDALSGFQTFTFDSGFTNLTEVQLWNDGIVQFDNVNVTPVPWETDALPVVGSTVLFGLGIWGKHKLAQRKTDKKD